MPRDTAELRRRFVALDEVRQKIKFAFNEVPTHGTLPDSLILLLKEEKAVCDAYRAEAKEFWWWNAPR